MQSYVNKSGFSKCGSQIIPPGGTLDHSNSVTEIQVIVHFSTNEALGCFGLFRSKSHCTGLMSFANRTLLNSTKCEEERYDVLGHQQGLQRNGRPVGMLAPYLGSKVTTVQQGRDYGKNYHCHFNCVC